MLFRQKIFAIMASIFIMLIVIYLVKKKKLREEYSWLWLLTGTTITLLVIWYDLLILVSHLIGAILPTTTLFVFGLLFLMLISLHYSIQISKLSYQIKKMAQEMALLKGEMEGQGDSLISENIV
jgi:hypothetical protein